MKRRKAVGHEGAVEGDHLAGLGQHHETGNAEQATASISISRSDFSPCIAPISTMASAPPPA
jgi:hypothetical protein